ncbi:hypothetical protein OAT67_07800 [Bacteriovoracaceae bacterium]|nr:hypothetical protein [Bacteriovoracaceae bacterium]
MGKVVETQGSVRVDLLGGTIDLRPINLILPNVVTLNLASGLKAKVRLEETSRDGIEIISKDYESENFFPSNDFTQEKLCSDHFGPLSFVAQIIDLFELHKNLKVTLESGSPAGAGLGGSSSMGVTLYKALCEYTGKSLDRENAIHVVNDLEGRILNCGPAGYQDYYPALFGGVLALKATPGKVEIEQLFTKELKVALEQRLTLVYSGQTRLSGINNWEVYKQFFDGVEETRHGLSRIAELSADAYHKIKNKQFSDLADLIKQEGEVRRNLFPKILSPEMEKLYNSIENDVPGLGIKVCGAGGGGCFLLVHNENEGEKVKDLVTQYGMTVLDFQVESSL